MTRFSFRLSKYKEYTYKKSFKEILKEAEIKSKEKFDKNTIKKIENFLEDYCLDAFSKAAMEYAKKYADSPDEIEEYLDYFDDIVYIDFNNLIKDIKKKLNITIDKNDRKEIEKIMNRADCGNVKLK